MENIGLLVNSPEYIESHLKDKAKTDDIANACYCSRSTLEKLFNYVYHISVHDYIVIRKMMLAGKLLSEHPELSILSVAVEYGYNSHEVFARTFKEIWQCTPSEFRNKKYIKNMIDINKISRKAGDLAILESMRRIQRIVHGTAACNQ